MDRYSSFHDRADEEQRQRRAAKGVEHFAPQMLDKLQAIDRWLSGYGTKDRREIHVDLRAFLESIGRPTHQ